MVFMYIIIFLSAWMGIGCASVLIITKSDDVPFLAELGLLISGIGSVLVLVMVGNLHHNYQELKKTEKDSYEKVEYTVYKKINKKINKKIDT